VSAALAILGGVAPWAAMLVASVIGVFVVFTGVALFVALFDDDEARAVRAMVILKDLLSLFRRGFR
jgi:hypothetical protein